MGLLDKGVHKLFEGVHNFYLRVFNTTANVATIVGGKMLGLVALGDYKKEIRGGCKEKAMGLLVWQ